METNETVWIKEFERCGERIVRNSLATGRGADVGINTETKRQAAFRWLEHKVLEREQRTAEIHWYAKWAFLAATGALVMSALGLLLAILFPR